eukprot:g1334.t1
MCFLPPSAGQVALNLTGGKDGEAGAAERADLRVLGELDEFKGKVFTIHPSQLICKMYVEKLGIAGLSRSQRGLDSGNVLALLPVGGGRLVSALQLPSFQRLGLEEPMPGTSQLEQKYLPSGQRHVHVDLPISKTRAKRAAKQGEVATSLSLGDQPASRPSASCLRPPIEQLICEPSSWPHANGRGGGKHEGLSDAFGSACEDFLDWLGALQLQSLGGNWASIYGHEDS